MGEEAAIGAVVDEMYAMISGPKGPRDWSRQDNCFHPDARQIRTGVDADGRAIFRSMGLADYARDTTPFFAENDFFELEIARRIDVLGNMAHVWSAYEARSALDDPLPVNGRFTDQGSPASIRSSYSKIPNAGGVSWR
ncbi:MAG TPA: hypothetical protein PKC32_14810 [Sphingopyxis sp.]|nr:hypothetical protein [Sphingopyxis sp.]